MPTPSTETAHKLRQRAEEKLALIGATSSGKLTPDQTQRLLHEMQVHQVELEMQNEELRSAIAEKEAIQALYIDLYEFAPAGYFNIDRDATIHAVNMTGADFLGVERALLVNNRLDAFVSDETRPTFHEFLDKVFASDAKETCEVVFVTKRSSTLFVQIDAVVTESGKNCRAVIIDITSRKQATEALSRSQKTLFELVERSPFGTYIVDAQFRIAMMNTASQTGAFRNVQPVIGRNFAEAMHILWPEEVAGEIIGLFRHTLDTGEAYRSRDFFNPRLDAESREAYEWELHRMTLPDGQYGVICYYYDSTKLRQSEAVQRLSVERLRLVLKASSIGSFEVDLQTGKGHWNDVEYELLGLKPGDVPAGPESFFQYVHPVDVGFLKADWEDALQAGELDAEFRIIRADRQERWLAGKGRFIYDDDGRASRFMGVNYDITARKQAEMILARYKLLAQHSRDIILFLRREDGCIIEANTAAVTAYGYDHDMLLGLTINDLRAPESREMTISQMNEADSHGILFQTLHRRKDGSTFPVEVSSCGATVDGQRNLISIIRDITERKQAESFRSMGQDILQALSEENNKKEAIKKTVDIIKSTTGVDAVGIRLQDEDDFPYFYQEGFPEDFLLKENSLLVRTKDGGICRDECGNICLECTCGLVVSSKTDPSSPLFTKGGSSWTNDSFPFLHVPLDDEIRTNPRNECIHQGFASVALIPIRAKGSVVGLLQLNDRRKGCFTLEGIEALEKIAENIGESMLRNQAEEALRESEQQFRVLIQNLKSAVALVNENGEFTIVNRAFLQIFELNYDSSIINVNARDWSQWKVFDEDGSLLDVDEHPVRKAALTGMPVRDKLIAVKAPESTELKWLLVGVEPTMDAQGQIHRLICTYHNITARKMAENALREREEQLRSLADSMFNLAWWANGDGYITWYNKRWYEYTGTMPEQMEGWGWQRVHDPNELPKVLEHWQTSIATGKPFEMTFPLRGSDGVYRLFLTRAIPLKDGSGRVQQWFGTNTDVNELEQRVADRTKELATSISHLKSEILERELAEKKLREETAERLQATEALREKERMLIQQNRQAAMGEMIGNIAHQWRQPLNTLGLYTQRLGAFYGMPNFNKEFLDNSIAKSMEIIRHMSKTIDDFRDYFKPEKEKTDFYLIEAIKSTLSLLEGNFHNPKIAIDLVERGNPVINGFQNEFAQAFLNILNNARDAIIEREITDAKVMITICSENNCAVVTVADNAGGIPEEFIDKVFDPYFTTKGPQVGTGIGLFMSKTIIEKNMGGCLSVRNTDIGAEFRIEVAHGTQN